MLIHDKPLEAITNYLRIEGGPGTAGQPTAPQFADIARAGYQVVINLAMPDSDDALGNEQEIVEAEGMSYVPIPVVWENPRVRDMERFSFVMNENEGREVFVHCAMNMRVSAFVYLYRVIRLGVPKKVALADMHRIWQPNATWQSLVDQVLTRYGLND